MQLLNLPNETLAEIFDYVGPAFFREDPRRLAVSKQWFASTSSPSPKYCALLYVVEDLWALTFPINTGVFTPSLSCLASRSSGNCRFLVCCATSRTPSPISSLLVSTWSLAFCATVHNIWTI